MSMNEFLPQVFEQSRQVILDLAKITPDTPEYLNIKRYFEECETQGVNPRDPARRQAFNDRAIELSGYTYLIGAYAEDRLSMLKDTAIAREGRTYHMGIDIFCAGQPPVFAPCDGEVIRRGFEQGFGGYGNYLLFQAHTGELLLFGHLASGLHATGRVRQGETLGYVGDFKNGENGGWSRHLHLQQFRTLPPDGQTPDGYSSAENLGVLIEEFPDPRSLFPNWKINLG